MYTANLQFCQLEEIAHERRKQIIERVWLRNLFRYGYIPDWQLSGDLADDPILNEIVERKERLLTQKLWIKCDKSLKR